MEMQSFAASLEMNAGNFLNAIQASKGLSTTGKMSCLDREYQANACRTILSGSQLLLITITLNSMAV
jgi:hypothetical protein